MQLSGYFWGDYQASDVKNMEDPAIVLAVYVDIANNKVQKIQVRPESAGAEGIVANGDVAYALGIQAKSLNRAELPVTIKAKAAQEWYLLYTVAQYLEMPLAEKNKLLLAKISQQDRENVEKHWQVVLPKLETCDVKEGLALASAEGDINDILERLSQPMGQVAQNYLSLAQEDFYHAGLTQIEYQALHLVQKRRTEDDGVMIDVVSPVSKLTVEDLEKHMALYRDHMEEQCLDSRQEAAQVVLNGKGVAEGVPSIGECAVKEGIIREEDKRALLMGQAAAKALQLMHKIDGGDVDGLKDMERVIYSRAFLMLDDENNKDPLPLRKAQALHHVVEIYAALVKAGVMASDYLPTVEKYTLDVIKNARDIFLDHKNDKAASDLQSLYDHTEKSLWDRQMKKDQNPVPLAEFEVAMAQAMNADESDDMRSLLSRRFATLLEEPEGEDLVDLATILPEINSAEDREIL